MDRLGDRGRGVEIQITGRDQRWLGHESRNRFGVVATGNRNVVWLDNDHSWHRWPLPLG